jgi:hypothetical protein
MREYISPWSEGGQRIPSPDGSFWAVVEDATEFQMSGPMVGTLRLSDRLREELCGVSLVWSDDSRYLAVPRLDPVRPAFEVLVIRAADGARRRAPGRYGPIALLEFRAGMLTLLEGDREMTVDLSHLRWS